jgi:Protein of unknown function (DUF2516)
LTAAISGIGGVVLLLGLASFVISIWALIDAAIRPGTAFKAAGQNKVLWIVLPIVGILLFTIIGGVLGIVYLTVIRPKVVRAQAEGLGAYPPTGYPSGGYAQPGYPQQPYSPPAAGPPPPPPPPGNNPPPPQPGTAYPPPPSPGGMPPEAPGR